MPRTLAIVGLLLNRAEMPENDAEDTPLAVRVASFVIVMIYAHPASQYED